MKRILFILVSISIMLQGCSTSDTEMKAVKQFETVSSSTEPASSSNPADVPEYLSKGWKSDMPVVEEFKVDSDTAFEKDDKLVIRNGDSITVSGDGCTEKEVSISISLNGSGNERFLLGKVTPEYGKWEWKGIICYTFTSFDGKDAQLSDGLYDITAATGSSEKSICGIVELGKGYYREFGAREAAGGKFNGAVFTRYESLYLYNEDKDIIKILYRAPAFQSLIGLSPDKGRIAFLCGAAGEKAIGIYDIKKGGILYIPLENRYAYQAIDAWWQNDRVMVVSGHVNPSANGFVCYDAATGKELSYCCGQLQATASDGRFMLFRLSPHWTDDPPADNICSSNEVQALYSVKNPKDIINFVELSSNNKKVFFIETLNKNGNIRLNLANLNNNGTVLSNLIKTEINVKGSKFREAFAADDLTDIVLNTVKDDDNDSAITSMKLMMVNNEFKIVDTGKASLKEEELIEANVEPSRVEKMSRTAGEYFKESGKMDEMGIESIDWF